MHVEVYTVDVIIVEQKRPCGVSLWEGGGRKGGRERGREGEGREGEGRESWMIHKQARHLGAFVRLQRCGVVRRDAKHGAKNVSEKTAFDPYA